MIKTAIGLTAIAAGLLLTGCHSTRHEQTDFTSVALNLTPDVQTLTERPIDINASMAIARDHNLRMFSEDIGRVFFVDHPSRLSPYPITYTSGQPR